MLLSDVERRHEAQQLTAIEKDLPDKEQMGSLFKGLLVALGVLAAAVITLITVFSWVHWSAAQTALVTAEAGAVIGLISALVAHFYPSTPKEPVAIAATLTACISASLALGAGFGWWSWTQEQISAVVAVVTAVLGVGGAIIARRTVFAKLRHKT